MRDDWSILAGELRVQADSERRGSHAELRADRATHGELRKGGRCWNYFYLVLETDSKCLSAGNSVRQPPAYFRPERRDYGSVRVLLRVLGSDVSLPAPAHRPGV